MALDISPDGITYSTTYSATETAFMVLRCTTGMANVGGWYGGVTDAWQDPGVNPDMERVETPFVSLAGLYDPNAGAHYPTNPSIPCRPEDGASYLWDALHDPQTRQESPTAVESLLDPLYLPQTAGAEFVSQQFGLTLNPAWPMSGESINLDAVVQEAVWRRIFESVTVTKKEFFNSDEWANMLVSGVYLGITLIGLRGPDQPPGAGAAPGQPPPPLKGFPSKPPKFLVSNQALVTFGGAHQVEVNFWFKWKYSGTLIPLTLAVKGGKVRLPGAGYHPKMQVLFERVNGPGSHVLDLEWSAYGRVEFTVPLTAASGLHSVTKYRFRRGELGGVPIYSEWTDIAPANAPVVAVQ